MTTTTAGFLAERGVTMDEAHGLLMGIVQFLANWEPLLPEMMRKAAAQGYVSAFAHLGITEQMLADVANHGTGYGITPGAVRSFFDMFGADTSLLPGSLPNPYVYAISSPTITEGETLAFHVILNNAAVMPMRYALQASGDALYDMTGYSLTNGVTLDVHTMQLVVPEGVGSFDILLDIGDDTALEGTETLTLRLSSAGESMGWQGYSATGTVNDNDTGGTPTGVALMPYDIAAWADNMHLNANTGMLSTEALRAAVIEHTNEADYWALFDAAGYVGAADGTFSNADTGWTLGNQPATAATVESVFYGTLVAAVQSIDFGEEYNLATFMYMNPDAMYDEDKFAQLVNMLDAAFGDAAGDQRAFSDAEIAEEIIDATITLVGYVQYSPSLFHSLLSWTEA